MPRTADGFMFVGESRPDAERQYACSCGITISGNGFQRHVKAGRVRGEKHELVIPEQGMDQQAERMSACVAALRSYEVSGIKAGAVTLTINAGTNLDAEAERLLAWCDAHPTLPVPRNFKTKLSDACRVYLEARASLGDRRC